MIAIEDIKCGQLVAIRNGCHLSPSQLSDDESDNIIGVASRDITTGSLVEYVVNENTDDISTHVTLVFSTRPDITIDFGIKRRI